MKNLKYGKCSILDLELILEIWNEEYSNCHFLKPQTNKSLNELVNNQMFSWDNTISVKDGNTLVGYLFYYDNIISVFLVRKGYRKHGLASNMFKLAEKEIKEKGYNEILIKYTLPMCFSWYIPYTNNHDHPCAPGIRINSNEYLFLSHLGYDPYIYQDAFHLDLKEFNISDSINKILKALEMEDIKIEIYNKDVHYGLDEFYESLKIDDFINVIKYNLNLQNPKPFLVVSKNNRIVGWTGAMWNEESGRGHFDGIAILDEVRGKGIGKALFNKLVEYNKNNGAEFMTFYTGLTNHARFIYKSAGFKIVQSFCYMKKTI